MQVLAPVNTVAAHRLSRYGKESKEYGKTKKEKELKRNHPVMLRFTDVEYEVITENAKNAKRPLAEYVRLQALNKKITTKYEIVADIPGLKKLITEFGRIGNNLNQIAKYFNQGNPQSQEMLQSLRQYMAQLYEMKYEVMKMAGDFQSIQK